MEKLKIFETISAVMEEVGAIGKNKKNQQGNGFMYRGIDDVMNALNPAMVHHKLFVTPEILEQTREERTTKNGGTLLYSIIKIKFTFYADDGSNIAAVVIGEAMDSGDKATNKAMSVAYKYACFQVFCIPTEEMKDPDAETHSVLPKQGNAKPVSKETPNESKTQNDVAPTTITEKEATVLKKLVEEKGYSIGMLFKIPLEELTQEQYAKAIDQISKLKSK